LRQEWDKIGADYGSPFERLLSIAKTFLMQEKGWSSLATATDIVTIPVISFSFRCQPSAAPVSRSEEQETLKAAG
jgi:hypothetical protein